MKYIIFSDIHLHTWSSNMDNDTRLPSRLLEQKNVLQQVLDITKEHNATLLFGGDFLHSVGKVPVEALNVMYWFFEECKKLNIPFYVCVGNHDIVLRSNGNSYHSVLTPFHNKEERNKSLEALKIKFVDYDDHNFADVQGYDIVILHKQPALVNQHHHKLEGVNWQKIESNNRLCFYGHDHTLRRLSDKSIVIGCPMHLNRADSGQDRGCWIVDTDNWKPEFIKLTYTEIIAKTEEEKKDEEVVFEAKIKSTSFEDILIEWLQRQDKPKEYLDLIKNDITAKMQVVKPFFTGKVSSLYINNILSIEELTVDFKRGLNLIIGKNGSGKSSIFEALMWTLFEETTKALAKGDIVRDRPTKQKDGYTELVLAGEDAPYIIKRSFKNGLEVFEGDVCLTEGMGKLQAQQFLENNILGFNKTVYMAACYFSQEQLTMLAQLGDADTTNMVTNILGFDTYDSLYVDMDLKVKECDLKIKLLNDEKLKISNDIWKNEEQQKNIKEQIKSSQDQESSLKNELSEVVSNIEKYTKELCNITVPSVTVKEYEDSLLSLNDKKVKTLDTLKNLHESLTKLHATQSSIEKEQLKFNNEVELTKKEIERHNQNIKKLENRELGQRCNHCGALVTKENVQSFIDDELKAIALIVTPIAVKNYSELLDNTYAEEATLISQVNELNISIGELDAQVTKVQKDKELTLESVTKANICKENLTRIISDLIVRKEKNEFQLKQINKDTKVEELRKSKVNREDLESAVKGLDLRKERLTHNLTIYDFWKSSFSNKGIRPLLLDKFCHTFNQIVKPLCKQVNGGKFNIEFTPTATTRGGQERNKLGLNVIYKDKTVLYQGLSGGEKTRVNLPLCFGLNKFITKQYGITGSLLGIIILDEIFANVDHDGEEDIASFLNNEAHDKYIGVITHSDELIAYSNNIWKITKKDDVTQLEMI